MKPKIKLNKSRGRISRRVTRNEDGTFTTDKGKIIDAEAKMKYLRTGES